MKLLHCYTANSKRIKCHQKIGLLALKSSKTLAWIVSNAMLKSEAVLNTFSVDQNARWDQETTSPLTNSWRSDGVMARIIQLGPPRLVFHRCFKRCLHYHTCTAYMYVVHVRRIPIRSTCKTYMCDSVNIHRTCTAYMYGVHVRRTCMIV